MIRQRRFQRGFSMVELLVAAFVLGVGILGLTLLQVAAIRVNTSSSNTSRALAIADRTLETTAMEGRRSMLWKTEGRTPASSSYTYVGSTGTVPRYVTLSGKSFTDESAAKATGELVFTVKVTPSETIDAQATVDGASTILGRSTIFTVEVSYIDLVVNKSGTQTSVPRYVRLARRVSHA